MKSEEEIEQLAFLKYPRVINDPYNPMEDDNTYERKIWIGAYTQCQEDMADKWISVKDRLPTEESYILIYGKGNRQMTSLFKNSCFMCYDLRTEWLEEAEEITHWMPLPNKPLNKQE
jgi:hypothetical protein